MHSFAIVRYRQYDEVFFRSGTGCMRYILDVLRAFSTGMRLPDNFEISVFNSRSSKDDGKFHRLFRMYSIERIDTYI